MAIKPHLLMPMLNKIVIFFQIDIFSNQSIGLLRNMAYFMELVYRIIFWIRGMWETGPLQFCNGFGFTFHLQSELIKVSFTSICKTNQVWWSTVLKLNSWIIVNFPLTAHKRKYAWVYKWNYTFVEIE